MLCTPPIDKCRRNVWLSIPVGLFEFLFVQNNKTVETIIDKKKKNNKQHFTLRFRDGVEKCLDNGPKYEYLNKEKQVVTRSDGHYFRPGTSDIHITYGHTPISKPSVDEEK